MSKLLSLLLILVADPSWCLYSRWLRNTNLNNPYNWDRGNLPCGNDRMILPDDGPVVYMQLNTTIQELVMPRSGELVFGSYATLAFTNEPDHSAACLDSGTDITFNASEPADWFDPDNWCPSDTEQGSCKTLAQLDSERIPCVTDDVVFPLGSSYYVDLRSNLNIVINTIKVSGKAYSTSTFRDFLATDNGRNIFPPPRNGGVMSSVSMNRRRCTDQTGCACGNDQPPILTTVCAVLRPRCARPRCSTTVRPVGHCCDVCGGMLNITYGAGFNLDTLKSAIQRNYLDNNINYRDVQYIVSKRFDGKIQMVLLDNDGIKSSQAADEIMAAIQDDINDSGVRYGVTEVKMVASVSTATPSSSSTTRAPNSPNASGFTGTQRSMSGGSVAGITIGCMIAVLALGGAGFLVYKRKYKPEDDSSGFSANVFNKFNRFNTSQKRKPQVSVPPSVGFNWDSQDSGLSSISGHVSQGFDNPMYGATPLEELKSMELDMKPSSGGSMSEDQPKDLGFDNPLYDVDHQESLFSDPSLPDSGQPTVMTIGGHGQKDTDA